MLSVAIATLTIISILLVASCQKPDETIPEIKLKGGEVDTVILNEKLIDPGAQAVDKVDGNISPDIKSDYLSVINKDSVGLYEVTYLISDKAGNANKKTRSVYVMNQAQNWEGTYGVVDTLFTPLNAPPDTLYRKVYTIKIVASYYRNKEIWIGGFGKFTAPSATPAATSINLIATVVDSAGSFLRASTEIIDLPNLYYAAAPACQTTSHRIRSYRNDGSSNFYLTGNIIQFVYEDEIYAPIGCTGLYYGKVKLTK